MPPNDDSKQKSETKIETASVAPFKTTTLVPDNTDDDGMQRFTAAGRPKPSYNPSSLSSGFYSPLGHGGVQHLPTKFTDESIINVPIPINPPSSSIPNPNSNSNTNSNSTTNNNRDKEGKRSWISKLGDGINGIKGKKDREEFRMVKMTRGEYLRYWARDEEGRYIGTEPEGKGWELWKDR